LRRLRRGSTVSEGLMVIGGDVSIVSPAEEKPTSEAVAEFLEGRKKYEDQRKEKLKKGSTREQQVEWRPRAPRVPERDAHAAPRVNLPCCTVYFKWRLLASSRQTLALLNRFKSKLSSAITDEAPEVDVEELAEDDDKGWSVEMKTRGVFYFAFYIYLCSWFKSHLPWLQ